MKIMREHGRRVLRRDGGPEHAAPYGRQAWAGGGGSELKAGLNEYLSKTPKDFPVRSLADVIAFNERNRIASCSTTVRRT